MLTLALSWKTISNVFNHAYGLELDTKHWRYKDE